MKQRTITSVFIFLVTALAVVCKLLPLTIGEHIFDIFVLVITLVAGFEMCNIMEKMGKTVNRFLTTMYCVFNYIITLIGIKLSLNIGVILLVQVLGLGAYYLITLVVEYFLMKKTPIKEHAITSLNTIIACVYPSMLFCLMLIINHSDIYAGMRYFSLVFILLILAITMLTDTFAYLVGRTFKGPKLAPSISPNKTISGAVGGLIGGVVGAMLVYALVYNVGSLSTLISMYNLSWWKFLIIGVIGSAVGQAGDLFESKLKRVADVKDSGAIFPGHGGMLDRIDANIFVTTFMYIVVTIILI